ncbi:hypothetical protein J6590_018452 [Homalodisca vitripennis]|nr:hypothetical protein J6590_018452 [Homalodisca vitripennis]
MTSAPPGMHATVTSLYTADFTALYYLRCSLLGDENLTHSLYELVITDVKCNNRLLNIDKQYTLLMCAARNNRLSVVNFLLDSLEHVDVDLVDMDRQTALHHAAQAGHKDVVARIVQAGANTKVVNRQGRTALHLASEKGHVDVVEFLLRHEAQMETRDEDGNSPLHLAVENKHLMVTQLLLESGTPPDIDNHKGMTALHIASSLGCRGIIDTLLQYGSDVDKQSKNGCTPLHLASEANDCETVELLISKGADLNALNSVRLHSLVILTSI